MGSLSTARCWGFFICPACGGWLRLHASGPLLPVLTTGNTSCPCRTDALGASGARRPALPSPPEASRWRTPNQNTVRLAAATSDARTALLRTPDTAAIVALRRARCQVPSAVPAELDSSVLQSSRAKKTGAIDVQRVAAWALLSGQHPREEAQRRRAQIHRLVLRWRDNTGSRRFIADELPFEERSNAWSARPSAPGVSATPPCGPDQPAAIVTF